jgi:zinc/manganese transport system substrate-binding protein
MNTNSKTNLAGALILVGLVLADVCHAKINVVVTTPDLASIVKVIGGSEVEITTLARATEDPHFVDARPSFIARLNKADALVEGGAELESAWLGSLLEGARNPKIASGAVGRIACNEGVRMLEVPTVLDRSKGDIHAAGNPHYLMDPANARVVASHVADAFGKLDPKSAELYSGNLKKFVDALGEKLSAWEKALAPFKGQRIVSYHNSWPYFSDRFGVKVDLFLEPKPGIPPTPAHLAGVIAKMKEEKVRVIFVEPFLNRKTAETVARNAGATALDVSQFPGGVKGTEGGYIALFDYLVSALVKALAAGADAR